MTHRLRETYPDLLHETDRTSPEEPPGSLLSSILFFQWEALLVSISKHIVCTLCSDHCAQTQECQGIILDFDDDIVRLCISSRLNAATESYRV